VDSTAAPTAAADSLSPGADSLALADSSRPLDQRIAALDRAAATLPQAERGVFAELVAAAREMLADGDSEAATLLVEDADRWLRQKVR
jgi:hypothetical protein